jgi:hypothetical protein
VTEAWESTLAGFDGLLIQLRMLYTGRAVLRDIERIGMRLHRLRERDQAITDLRVFAVMAAERRQLDSSSINALSRFGCWLRQDLPKAVRAPSVRAAPSQTQKRVYGTRWMTPASVITQSGCP